MSWAKLRPQIATLLGTIPSFGEVASTPKLKFDSYPAAHIIPSELDSDYETNIENERVYAFIVRLFYETKTTGVAQALTNLETTVDSVIDAIDNEDKNTGSRTVGVDLDSSYTFLGINATPGIWGELVGENLIFAELRVRVKLSYDAS